jgi:hypothetical protein
VGTTVEFPRADGSNDICTSQEGLHLQQALRNEIMFGGGSGHGVFFVECRSPVLYCLEQMSEK